MRNLIFLAVSIGFYFGMIFLFGKQKTNAKNPEDLLKTDPRDIIKWLSIILAIALILGTPYWGTKIPGSFFERDEYEGMFYVNLFPYGERTINYRVPALIEATIEESSHDDTSWRRFIIVYAVMQNEKIFFDLNDANLKLNNKVLVSDNERRSWVVELTNKPVKD